MQQLRPFRFRPKTSLKHLFEIAFEVALEELFFIVLDSLRQVCFLAQTTCHFLWISVQMVAVFLV